MTKMMIVRDKERGLDLRIIEETKGQHGEACYAVCKASADWKSGHGRFRVRQDKVTFVKWAAA